jgi:hypothetical protein
MNDHILPPTLARPPVIFLNSLFKIYELFRSSCSFFNIFYGQDFINSIRIKTNYSFIQTAINCINVVQFVNFVVDIYFIAS